MSHRANYWLASLAPSRVKAGAFRILFHLCDHHNDERDPSVACFPSQETLRAKTGLSNGALNTALACLEEDGLIRRRRTVIPGTPTQRTYYVLQCDFGRVEEQTPKDGVCPNSGAPEFANGEQTPVFEGANSGFQGSKLRCTGEEPVSNLKGTLARTRTRGARRDPSAESTHQPEAPAEAEKGHENGEGIDAETQRLAEFWGAVLRRGGRLYPSSINMRVAEAMVTMKQATPEQLRAFQINI